MFFFWSEDAGHAYFLRIRKCVLFESEENGHAPFCKCGQQTCVSFVNENAGYAFLVSEDAGHASFFTACIIFTGEDISNSVIWFSIVGSLLSPMLPTSTYS